MNIEYIIIHAAATAANMDIGAKEINDWHIARGWRGIGYHFVIRRDGLLERGRPLNQEGAHTIGYNNVSWGVCMVGGADSTGKSEDNFTIEQYDTLRTLVYTLSKMAPGAKIVGHRDLSKDKNGDGVISEWEWVKDCPCFDVSKFLKEGIPCKKKKAWQF